MKLENLILKGPQTILLTGSTVPDIQTGLLVQWSSGYGFYIALILNHILFFFAKNDFLHASQIAAPIILLIAMALAVKKVGLKHETSKATLSAPFRLPIGLLMLFMLYVFFYLAVPYAALSPLEVYLIYVLFHTFLTFSACIILSHMVGICVRLVKGNRK